ncbi:MAG TPA: hypothetical protein ACFYD6_14725 [Candidatus Brocadiia bacterium]
MYIIVSLSLTTTTTTITIIITYYDYYNDIIYATWHTSTNEGVAEESIIIAFGVVLWLFWVERFVRVRRQ